jgi:uncharacterized protein (TIGR03083 family)
MSEFALDLDVDFSEHLEAIRESLAGFVDYARRAGLDAAVPTAPEWTVRELIAHQGMVHRWATDNLRGRRADPAAYEREGLEADDPVVWLHEGGLRLVRALEHAPTDLEALVFLNHAPAPRLFWARRQCHETTIHSVDALAASLGRLPTAAETWITQQIALDGIDELLLGFMTRPRARLRSEKPLTFAVRPNDVRRSWTVRVSTEAPVVERGAHGHADVVLEGTAEQLYLALWNRSDEIHADGFDLWHDTAKITWA